MCVNVMVFMLSCTWQTATFFAHSGNSAESPTNTLESIMADSRNTAEGRTSALETILADSGNTAENTQTHSRAFWQTQETLLKPDRAHSSAFG